MNRRRWWIGTCLVLTLLSAACADTGTGIEPDLNEVYLDGLLFGFSPVYNYTSQPTRILGHIARVTPRELRPWQRSMGFTDRNESREVNQSSLFRIASVTKMFTATVVLQLSEEGLVDLDAPFNHYLQLDEATHPKIPLFENVLVRHLLSHRSGVPYISSTTFFDVYGYESPIEQSDKIRVLFTEGEPIFEPGSEYSYSNSNFTILGLIIEAVTGMPYHEALQEKIYARIGLTTTGVLDYDMLSSDRRLAHGYTSDFDGIGFHGSHGWASGGLVSNVRELTMFMRALVDGRLFQDPSTFDLMVTPVAGGHYGMGMFITQTPLGVSYGHGGAVFGYNTNLYYFPELDAILAANLTFDGIDFLTQNWMDDFCLPAMSEVQRAQER